MKNKENEIRKITLEGILYKINFKTQKMLFTFIILYALLFFYLGNTIAQSLEDKIQIENLSRSAAWNDRYRAGFLIKSFSDIDTSWAIETAINGIRYELENPSSSELKPGSYATNSEKILQEYVKALVQLGPSITESLNLRKNTLSGDLKNWIIISLGFLKNESVHDELKSVFLNNPDLFTRLMSIRALGTYADSTDIPIFLDAYTDTSRVTMMMDHDIAGGDFEEEIFPLVGAAVQALQKMGYEITVDSTNVPIIRAINKGGDHE